jgi:hypothetical protein
MTVISYPSEIFLRLNSVVTAFYVHVIVHTVISNDTAHKLAKRDHSSILTNYDSSFLPVWDISTFKQRSDGILRACHSAHCNKQRYKPKTSQNAIIRRLCLNMTVSSFPFEIFRCLNVQITALYAPNTVHAVKSNDTSLKTRKTRSFVDFNEKWQ